MQRKINLIVVHCSDSDNPNHDNPETIKKWHLERGFKNIGYHAFIDKSGKIHTGRPEDVPGAHVKGKNSNTLGVCLSGKNEFTNSQFLSLEKWCLENCSQYDLEKSQIVGHRDLDKNKTCPNFEVKDVTDSWEWN
jgi:N-acetylmuramoyl-L-alanine amidase